MGEHSTRAGSFAIVTGGTSGIGRAIVEALAARAVTVWAIGRRLEQLNQLSASFPNVRAYQADLTDDAQLIRMRDALKDERPVDILVHGAAVMKIGSFADASIADLDWQYRTNVRAPYLLTQLLLPLLSDRADVVFLNSSAGLSARGGLAQYGASKHALKAIADSLREELHPSGRRVLSVFAGRTATPMQQELLRMEGRPYNPAHLVEPKELATIVVDALQMQSAEIKEINLRPRFE
jgi:NAD(P)-dependent dehydrogenase (short-subunit alcohol dehydrogenase family)